jgi:hypothetical protein
VIEVTKKREIMKLLVFIIISIIMIIGIFYGYVTVLGFTFRYFSNGFSAGLIASLFLYAIVKQYRKITGHKS